MDAKVPASTLRTFGDAVPGFRENGGMCWLASRFARGAVTVAYMRLPDADVPPLSRLVGRLPGDERQRAAGFRHDADRARFVYGRLLLRYLAARDLRDSPSDVDAIGIGVEEGGRPFVVEPPVPIFVSLAHSGRYVAAAAGRRPVGIDVEEWRGRPPRAGLAERVCSPFELRRLDALGGEARERAFMAIWARKEAYGKALGVGLGFGMRSVTIGPDGSRPRGAAGHWWVTDLALDPDYAAALVVAGGRVRARLVEVDPACLSR